MISFASSDHIEELPPKLSDPIRPALIMARVHLYVLVMCSYSSNGHQAKLEKDAILALASQHYFLNKQENVVLRTYV